jgi:hypothetical protein
VVGSSRRLAERDGRRIVSVVGPNGAERPREQLLRARGPAPRRDAGAASAGARAARGGVAGEEAGGDNALVVVPDRPGLWQVMVEDGGEPRLDPALAFAAVPDPRESDTRRIGEQELLAWFGGAEHASVAGQDQPERAIPLWSVLLVAALVAFFLEGVLAG